MRSLKALGFIERLVYEVVLSTYSKGKKPNAAPMGMSVDEKQRIIFKPFRSSLTHRNLRESRCGVANITSRPNIFFRTAFKEANPEGKIPDDWFDEAKVVAAPRLRFADGYIEFVVEEVEEDEDRGKFTCEARLVESGMAVAQPYCRGVFAAVESIIHCTRIREFLAQGKFDEAENLIRLVRNYGELAGRVSPESEYTEIIGWLLNQIEGWRKTYG